MSPTLFSVHAEFGAPLTDDAYDTLLDTVTTLHGAAAVGPTATGNASLRFTVKANSLPQASTHAIETAQNAGHSAGLPNNSLIAIEVITDADDDRRQTHTATTAHNNDELAGAAEAAQILGINESELADLSEELAPHLVQTLSAGPIYRTNGIRDIATQRRLLE